MDNRFGLKDLVLFVLLGGLILAVFLAMKQYDRQWAVLQAIEKQGEDQTRELADIARTLKRGMRPAAAPGPEPSGSSPGATRPATAPFADDPFARIRAAEALPGYAQGDSFINGITKIEKITPLVSTDIYAAEVQSRVLQSLVQRDPVTLKWQPLVARGWQISDDGLTITFQLRPDVVFSDGQHLTADDLLFTYNWIMNPQVEAPRLRAYYQKIKSLRKTGDLDVVFTFVEPYFKSFDFAGGMAILPGHFYGKYTPTQFNNEPGLLMGSGPYKMEDPAAWTPGKPLQLVRNDRYWGPAAPFDRVIYKTFGTDLAKLTDFRNGDIDAPDNLFPEQYREMLKDEKLLARTQHFEYESPAAGYRYLGWNERRKGRATRFADKRVRQAMTLLTDCQRMCDELNFGLATPIAGPFFGKNRQAAPELKPWPFDPERAKSLLKEAGFYDRDGDGILDGPDGQPFRFELIYPSGNPAYQQMVLFIKDSYTRAGIQLEPNPLEWPVFAQKLKNRDFDAITLGWGTSLEGDLYQMFHSDQMKDGGDDNVSYNNPELDKLIEQARRTVDEDKRMVLWQQCHRILYEDQPYTFLLTRKKLVFLDSRFKNVQLLPLDLNSDLEWFVPAAQQKR